MISAAHVMRPLPVVPRASQLAVPPARRGGMAATHQRTITPRIDQLMDALQANRRQQRARYQPPIRPLPVPVDPTL